MLELLLRARFRRLLFTCLLGDSFPTRLREKLRSRLRELLLDFLRELLLALLRELLFALLREMLLTLFLEGLLLTLFLEGLLPRLRDGLRALRFRRRNCEEDEELLPLLVTRDVCFLRGTPLSLSSPRRLVFTFGLD